MEEPSPGIPLFCNLRAYQCRAVSEFDSVQFAHSKEPHQFTIHEDYFGEIDRDQTLFLSDCLSERINVVSINPAGLASALLKKRRDNQLAA
jgi:hypothetical protein